MATSRLFVRGLPPGLGEDEFRKHFGRTAPVTDAKLIPHRRIGYLGYKTPEAAGKALEYHHRTFIRTARVHVEFAKSVAELRREPESGTGANEEELGPRRAKHGREETIKESENDPKLKEFLKTMRPGKTQIWANADTALSTEKPIQPAAADADKDASEEDYEPLPKRQKSEPEPQQRSERADAMEEAQPEPEQVVNPEASDADWLRTRTSRMLGLVDDGEKSELSEVEPVKGKPDPAPKAASDAGSQTDEDLHEVAPKRVVDRPTANPDIETKTDEHRLFVRNISYQSTEDDLRDYFSSFGAIEEVSRNFLISAMMNTDRDNLFTDDANRGECFSRCFSCLSFQFALESRRGPPSLTEQVHLPRNRAGASKGFAYIHFTSPIDASAAIVGTNAVPYQGRLLHVMPAAAKRDNTLDEYAISRLPLKKQQQIRRKADAASSIFRWNTLYMNSDAVMASTAAKLGVSKADILDPTSSSAAVKQAHAETNIIQETKSFFQSNGVNLESFGNRVLSETVLLVKNFPFGTSTEELRQLFEVYGTLKRVLMPPAGTMAIVELDQPDAARKAFGALAYRKLGDSVLFLEKAPRNILDGKVAVQAPHSTEADMDEILDTNQPSSTLFIKNLNFNTTSAKLYNLFLPLKDFMSARIKTKPDPKKPGQTLSMGFGFVEFRSKDAAQAALAAMNGYTLDGHKLQIKSSHRGLDAAEERRREDLVKKVTGRHTKIIIKNLPFETTRQDVRELFGPYGKLRSIRVPKKFDSSTRGFAFADFITVKEAQNAMEALAGAHLLGRRLNLEYAAEEAIDPEQEIAAMSAKVGRQVDKVAARQLTSVGRKKFTVNQGEEDDISFD